MSDGNRVKRHEIVMLILQKHKVVYMEDLAAEFGMKTQV